jgi:hypothetical protein
MVSRTRSSKKEGAYTYVNDLLSSVVEKSSLRCKVKKF